MLKKLLLMSLLSSGLLFAPHGGDYGPPNRGVAEECAPCCGCLVLCYLLLSSPSPCARQSYEGVWADSCGRMKKPEANPPKKMD